MTDEREQRNAVFGAAQQGVQAISMADKMKADFGLEIPVETVPLPSAGKVYPVDSSLHNVEMLDIVAMSAKHENILHSQALLKKGFTIMMSELIKASLTDKSINVNDLLVGDRNALMVSIRIVGYGSDFHANFECSECKENNVDHAIDMSQMGINRLTIDPVVTGQNLFEFLLPACKKTVRFKFLTVKEEEEISATKEKQKKLGLISDTSVTTNLLYSLVSVDGIEDRSKLANFVQVMPARDSLALRKFMRDNEPGIDLTLPMECAHCGNTEKQGVELTRDFFWPGVGNT